MLVLFMPITRRNGNAYYNFQHSNLRGSSKTSSMHFHQPCTLYRNPFFTIPILCLSLLLSFYQMIAYLSSCLFNSQCLPWINRIACCIIPFHQLGNRKTIHASDRIKRITRFYRVISCRCFFLWRFFSFFLCI